MATPTDLIDADHWVRQVVSPVLFSAALEAALASASPMVTAVLEVGPNPVLTRMAQSWIKPRQPLVWLASLDRQAGVHDAVAVARVAKRLQQHQQALQGNGSLPEQVFPDRRSFPWQAPPHPLLQQSSDLEDVGIRHKAVFHASLMKLFNDHTIMGMPLFPGAGFVEMALAAAAVKLRRQSKAVAGIELQGVSFLEPLGIEVGTGLVCEVGLDDGIQFRPVNEPRVVCEVNHVLAVQASDVQGELLSAVKARCVEEVVGIAERYKELQELGFHGPQFQTLVQVWRGKAEFAARLRSPGLEDNGRYHVHPAVLDGVFQLAGLADGAAKAWVPAAIGQLQLRLRSASSSTPGGSIWASGRVKETNDRFRLLDLFVYDTATDTVSMSIEDFRFMPLKAPPPASGLYEVGWVETPAAVDADSSASDEAPKLSLVALPGCTNLCNGVLQGLSAAGLSCSVMHSSLEAPATSEQWSAAGTLVVPLLRDANTAEMLNTVLDILQVQT